MLYVIACSPQECAIIFWLKATMSVYLVVFMSVIIFLSSPFRAYRSQYEVSGLNSSSSSSSSLARNGGGGGASAQLSHTEVAAVRQLIAGYRESAAFLLRSADELENLILQQNWTDSQHSLSKHIPSVPHLILVTEENIWLLKML